MNARKQAFSWINPNSLSEENSCDTATHDIFLKIIVLWTLENRRFLEFTPVCCQGKWKKSTGELLKTKEHKVIFVSLPNGEPDWKTREFLNSREFAVSENKRKQKKTSVNARIHFAFLTLTNRWIVENSVFCEIYQRLALWKTSEKAGFQSLTPDEREVLLPENIWERKQTIHSPSANRPVNSSKRAFSALSPKWKTTGLWNEYSNSPIAKQLENLGFFDWWTPVNLSKRFLLRKFTARFLNDEVLFRTLFFKLRLGIMSC